MVRVLEGSLQEVPRGPRDEYGKAAGMMRNKQMLDFADALVAFWDGESRGTENMLDIAANKGIPVRIIRY